jgi:hypothetical protein
MKIFYWPASTTDGCWAYRIDMVAEALAARGHDVRVDTRVGAWARDEADVWIGQRVCMNPPTAMWQAAAESGERPLVLELDDDLFSIDPRQNRLADVFKDPQVRRNLEANIRVADLVTVSTEPLAKVMRRYNPNVAVLPNSVRRAVLDMPLPKRRGKPVEEAGGRVVIGWQGSATHVEDWKVMGSSIVDIITSQPWTFMRFLGTFHPAGMTIGQFELLPWTNDLTEHYRRVARFDIGLAPLNGTLFNESKSALRFVEAAALGVPMVCSDVPAYRDVVEHGVTGFLARNPKQWREYVQALVDDPQLRVRIGDAAREAARAWTIEERVTLWEQAYGSLL